MDMTDRLIIAVAQLNATVGDVEGNMSKLLDARQTAAAQGADIIITPETYLSGYQIDDQVMVSGYLDHTEKAVMHLAKATADGGPAVIVGAPRRDGDLIRNSVYVLDEGEVISIRDKDRLPGKGVFDDPRNFTPGGMPGPVMLRGVLLGLPICEDLWHSDLIECLEENGAEIILSPNSSPYEKTKADERMSIVVTRINESGLPVLYVNLVGGQDDLVFDGGSFAVNPGGELAVAMPTFSEAVTMIEAHRSAKGWMFSGPVSKPDEGLDAVWRCLVLGIRDYTEKNDFDRVLLGLSGGVDSALVAVLAVDALGADRVDAVMMPSPYTSQISLDDASVLAENLGIRLDNLDIEPTMKSVNDVLAEMFTRGNSDLARENLQSRLRGLMLMSISNTVGQLLLTTGNKSEYATGYATLYGDMCGGYAPLIDVWKTEVYALSSWRNQSSPRGVLGPSGDVIPERIITRPPSAELRPDQKDSDSLPDYDRLDAIMQGLVENLASVEDIVADGHEVETVRRCAAMLMRAEYKRRQCAPGPKISARAFYRDRRFPITNRYPLAGES
jgi:NAD+ synthase